MIRRFILEMKMAPSQTMKLWLDHTSVPHMWSKTRGTLTPFERLQVPFWIDCPPHQPPAWESLLYEAHAQDLPAIVWKPEEMESIKKNKAKRKGGRTGTPAKAHAAGASSSTTTPSQPVDYTLGEVQPTVAGLDMKDDLMTFIPTQGASRGFFDLAVCDIEDMSRSFFEEGASQSDVYTKLRQQVERRHTTDSQTLFQEVAGEFGFNLVIFDLPNVLVQGGAFVDTDLTQMDPVKYEKALQFSGMHLAGTGYMAVFVTTPSVPVVIQAAAVINLEVAGTYNIYRARGWRFRDNMKDNLLVLLVLQSTEKKSKKPKKPNPLALTNTILVDAADRFQETWMMVQPKSVRLMQLLIERLSKPGDLIWDIGSGTGSSLVAAVELRKNIVGTEKSFELSTMATKKLAESSRPQEIPSQPRPLPSKAGGSRTAALLKMKKKV